jgi:hypothetical protein
MTVNLQNKIEEIVKVLEERELAAIEAATGIQYLHEELKKKLYEKLAKLRQCQTLEEVSKFLYANQSLGWFAAQRFIDEIDKLILEELRRETKGWEFISFEETYGPAAESVIKAAKVKDPEGVVHEFRYGNNGANGMGSEFRSFGTPPDGLALKVIRAEMLRRKLAGETFPLFYAVRTARSAGG